MALLDAVLLGAYVGVLTGVFTGFLAFVLAFGFKYLAGVKLSDRIALMIGMGIAGLQGGLLGLLKDPTLLRSPTIVTALLVVLLLTMYAHSKGADLGERIPRGVLTRRLWRRTLSSDVVERVGRFGHVRVRIAGEVDDLEGYPPVPERLRREITDGSWRFPADLPLAELEARLADRLHTDYDLAEIRVDIDRDGRATVAAAPPSGRLSRRVPAGQRAVSVETVLPAGLAPGDRVELAVAGGGSGPVADGTDDADGGTGMPGPPGVERVDGAVVSAPPRGTGGAGSGSGDATAEGEGEGAEPSDSPSRPAASSRGAAGGQARATVTVDAAQAPTVVNGDVRGLLARSRGGGPEFELVSLLRRDGNRFRKLTLRPESDGDGARLGDLDLRRAHGVDVLALRRAGEWTFAPSGGVELVEGDDLFAAGPRDGLAALSGVVA